MYLKKGKIPKIDQKLHEIDKNECLKRRKKGHFGPKNLDSLHKDPNQMFFENIEQKDLK